MNKILKYKNNLKGSFFVPGDKSISHRAVMFGSIANGTTTVHGFLTGEDCLSTISCFKKLGVDIQVNDTDVTVHGKGLHGLSAPSEILDVGNSGTTMRLISGLLCGQNFNCTLTGDASIQKRPMGRVSLPLSKMGAKMEGKMEDGKLLAPINITGSRLTAITYTLPVASAQVKSAIILAGLYAKGTTVVIEPEATRNHTEIMLNYLGANIEHNGTEIICRPVNELYGKEIFVPGDISSAAYFMVAGAICQNSQITIENVGINPTRIGIITVLENMGADITLQNKKTVCGEETADICVKTSNLKGTVIEGDIIPKLIDEIPIIAVAAAMADGITIIKDAQELKVKESNRIKTVVCELKKMGVDIEETEDGMIIKGGKGIKGAVCDSYDDHRIAMSLAVAALVADGETTITNTQCVDISFPNFFEFIERM
ncbi:MAG: 3-phosphoshikimate 1-carboxyvinyltransferase [Anaerotignaceae bacterium]